MVDQTHSYYLVDHDFRVEYNDEHGATGTYHNGEPHEHRYSHAERDEFGTTYHYSPDSRAGGLG
jgi:hypothetical protein